MNIEIGHGLGDRPAEALVGGDHALGHARVEAAMDRRLPIGVQRRAFQRIDLRASHGEGHGEIHFEGKAAGRNGFGILDPLMPGRRLQSRHESIEIHVEIHERKSGPIRLRKSSF